MGYLNEDGLATLVGKVKGQVVQLTSAEYRNLPDTKLSDNKTYFVTDEDYAYAIDDEPTLNSDNLVKSGGVYTYTSKIGSGTLTTTAQTIIPAINELKMGLTPQTITLNASDMTFPTGVSLYNANTITLIGKIAILGFSIKLENVTGMQTITNYLPSAYIPSTGLVNAVGETGLADGKLQAMMVGNNGRNVRIYPVNTGVTYVIGTVVYTIL